VLGDISGDFTADTVQVEGGSQNFPWKIDITGFKGSMKVKCKELDPDVHSMMMGGTLTDYSGGSGGAIIDTANVKGTSLFSAAGYIAPIVVPSTGAANLKPGWYVAIVLAGAATMDIYGYNSAHFKRGTAVSFIDEVGKLNASPITIPSAPAATVDVADLGLRFTRGASTLSVVAGDTMRFFVQSPFTESWKIKFGSDAAIFNDVMVTIESERDSGTGVFYSLYRCKCLGAPISLPRKNFAEYDFTITPQYDSVLDGVGEIIGIREVGY
jgi:hypothetical protein